MGDGNPRGTTSGWAFGYQTEVISNSLYAVTEGGGASHSHGNTGSTSLTTNSTTPGATGSSSNMPPYIQISIWRRTA